jgi:hypothetical protein
MCSVPERAIDSSQTKTLRPCDAVVPVGAQGFLHIRVSSVSISLHSLSQHAWGLFCPEEISFEHPHLNITAQLKECLVF